jgi:hypothetical protein
MGSSTGKYLDLLELSSSLTFIHIKERKVRNGNCSSCFHRRKIQAQKKKVLANLGMRCLKVEWA